MFHRDGLVYPFQLMAGYLMRYDIHPWEVSRQVYIAVGLIAGALAGWALWEGRAIIATLPLNAFVICLVASYALVPSLFLLKVVSEKEWSFKFRLLKPLMPFLFFAIFLGNFDLLTTIYAHAIGQVTHLGILSLIVMCAMPLRKSAQLHGKSLPGPRDARVANERNRNSATQLAWGYAWLAIRMGLMISWFLLTGSVEAISVGIVFMGNFIAEMFMQVDIPPPAEARRSVLASAGAGG